MIEREYVAEGAGGWLEQRRELLLWVLIGLMALTMRFVQLGGAPLSAAEARRATLAWRAVTGQGMPAQPYSPLLLAANSFAFTVFGASDGMARVWPALFGSLLALTPALIRRRLGRVGALGAGIYLAISPTALMASRQLDGTVIAAAASMGLIGGLSRFAETERRGWLWFTAISLALALVSAPAVYGLLLPLALAWVLSSQPWGDGRGMWVRRAISGLRTHGPEFFVVFAISAFILSTGLGWNLAGMGAAGSLVVAWFARFRTGEIYVASPLTLLLVYELLGLGLAMGGLLWCWNRDRRLGGFLSLWGGLGVVLLYWMGGRVPVDLMWVVVPLAMLTGLGLQALVRGDWSSSLAVRSVYAVFVLVLWAQAYLILARYANRGEPGDLVLVVVIGVVQVVLGLSFGFLLGPRATLRTGVAATSVVLLALMVSAGCGVGYRRASDARELLVSEPTAVNVRDLMSTLRDLSWHQTGMPMTLDFVYEAPADSVLSWYLRDFERAHRVDRLDDLGADHLGAIVVTMDRQQDRAVAPGEDYVGQDFPLQRRWTLSALGCRLWDTGTGTGCSAAVDWFLFRDSPCPRQPLPEVVEGATLWRRVEVMGVDE